MEKRTEGWFSWRAAAWAVLVLVLLPASLVAAQSRPPRSGPVAGSAASSDQDVAATRLQLLKLLRVSPRLTTVVARDPSLLADHEYVSRNNPELAQFLQDHPEIARNPEFYLFANAGEGNHELESEQYELRFERAVWPELSQRERQEIRREHHDNSRDLIPFMVFVFILGAILWLTRVFLQNRRWGKIFKVQTDTYSKLLEKFSTNEELLAYVRSDAGKRFLESASMPLNTDSPAQMGGLVSRVIGSLQLGILLTLVGIGLIALRSHLEDPVPLLVFGTLALMLGVGFIISSGVSFALGRHLKLLPTSNSKSNSESNSKSNSSSGDAPWAESAGSTGTDKS
ncbi:MAG TPA: hypothetical protein VNV88_11125 [Candidatus Solibacter sp.]|jgi:hypothetical protein|nr:hypothetical protein [Candidatus Solibacter sp.]